MAFFIGFFFLMLAEWHRHNKEIFFPVGGQLTGEAEKRRLNDLAIRKQWIEKRCFEFIYLDLLGRMLDGLATRFTRDQEHLVQKKTQKGWTGTLFNVNPFTEGSYLICLRLALIYPWLAFFVVWVLDGSGAFSGLSLLPDESTDIKRWGTFFTFMIISWSLWKAFRSTGIKLWLYFTIAIAGAGAGAGALSVTAVVALIFSFTFAGAGTGAIPVAVAVAAAFAVASVDTSAVVAGSAFACAVASAGAFNHFRSYFITSSAIGGYWITFNAFYLLTSIAFAVWILGETGKSTSLLLLVFIVMLPLINAFMDWLSLGFTRGFLYAIHQRSHNGMKAFLFVFFDVGLALIFLISIISLTVLLFASMNTAAAYWSGEIMMNMQVLFDGLAEKPLALEYTWIHFMMLSTLIPTLIHFTVAGAAAMMLFPNQWRQSILDQWETRGDALTGALWYITIVPALGLTAPIFALWLLYTLINAHGGWVGYALIDWARTLSTAFDPLIG